MRASLLRQITLYRFRYIIAYVLFVALIVGLLFTDISNIPYGLSDSEMHSAVASNSLNPVAPRLSDIVNLPYHLVQKVSIGLLGLSSFSIRLPSILLGLASAVVLAAMLNIWFKRNVAIIALLIAVSSVPFVAMSRSGTAAILYTFLLLALLYSAVKLTSTNSRAFGWKIVALLAGMMLLYIPFGLYTFIALAIAGGLHPHIRYQISHITRWQIVVMASVALFLLTPLVIAAIYDNGILSQLFGLSTIVAQLQPSAIGESAYELGTRLFSFSSPNVSDAITPYFNITFAFFALFGLIRIVIDHHAARSYLLLIWLAFSIPMLLVDISQLPLLFVPSMLLLAIGIQTFISEWYSLFPRNPYARLGGLVPIALIFVGIMVISVTRYYYAYSYTDTSSTYSPELNAIKVQLSRNPNAQLVVPAGQVSFYDILRAKNDRLTVVAPKEAANKGRRIVLDRSHFKVDRIPEHIDTSYTRNNAVLLRVYE